MDDKNLLEQLFDKAEAETNLPIDDSANGLDQEKYSTKIDTPIYTPSNKTPNIVELVDVCKTQRLIRKIERSGCTDEEKRFLVEAAHRHSAFHYSRIADYYAHASKEMQELMEESALVILDYKNAIKHGFMKLQKALLDVTKDKK